MCYTRIHWPHINNVVHFMVMISKFSRHESSCKYCGKTYNENNFVEFTNTTHHAILMTCKFDLFCNKDLKEKKLENIDLYRIQSSKNYTNINDKKMTQ